MFLFLYFKYFLFLQSTYCLHSVYLGRLCFTGSVSNRWNFIQGENAVQTNKLSKTSSSKLYRRKLQKRLLHHKQQLLNLQQAKKHFSTKLEESIASGNLLDKETEHLVKTQDLLFKKQMRQYSSKVCVILWSKSTNFLFIYLYFNYVFLMYCIEAKHLYSTSSLLGKQLKALPLRLLDIYLMPSVLHSGSLIYYFA